MSSAVLGMPFSPARYSLILQTCFMMDDDSDRECPKRVQESDNAIVTDIELLQRCEGEQYQCRLCTLDCCKIA